MFSNIHQRTSCDRRKNCCGVWCNYSVIFCYEQEVCSTCFLNFCSCSGVKVHIFIKTICVSCNNCVKAHCIVQSGFDVSCSMRCGAVKVWYAQCQWFHAALEVRSNRSGKYTELIVSSRFYTNYGIDSEHIRSDIKCCSCSVRWNVSFICLYCLNNSINEFIFRERRHLKTFRWVDHTLRIEVRTESDNVSILCCVSLHSFKYCLCILKNSGTFIHDDVRIFCETTFIPCSIFIISYKTLICRDISESDIFPVNVFFLHCSKSSIPLCGERPYDF